MKEPAAAKRARWLRRQNRRLRWKKGAFALAMIAPDWRHPNIRRDVVVRLLQQRNWRLALTVAVMPNGWSLKKEKPGV